MHKYTKRQHISKTKDEEFKYKLIHTPNQTVYSNIEHKWQKGYKVFISTTSYYSTFIDKCGMTQSIAFIRKHNDKVIKKRQAKKIKKVLDHNLYKFLNNICRWGNFNNIRILQSFPYCEDPDNVYTKFNITEEEIKFIEEVL